MWVLLKLLKSSQYSMDGHCVTRPSFQLKNLKVNTQRKKNGCAARNGEPSCKWKVVRAVNGIGLPNIFSSGTHESVPVCAGQKAIPFSARSHSSTTFIAFYIQLGIHLTFFVSFNWLGFAAVDPRSRVRLLSWDLSIRERETTGKKEFIILIYIFSNCYGCGYPPSPLYFSLSVDISHFSSPLSNWKRSIFSPFALLISASWERIVLFFTNRFVCIANN